MDKPRQEEQSPTHMHAARIMVKPETFRIATYLSFVVMVIVSTAITETSIPYEANSTALFTTFGYNNICIYFDFSPAKEVAAMIWPLAEYALAAYIILSYIKVYNAHHDGRASQRYLTASSVLAVVQLILVSWIRMIFVVSAEVSPWGHTAGFLCLQVALTTIAVENVIYHIYVSPVVPLERQLGRKCALTLGTTYIGTFILVTLIKMFLTVYALTYSLLSAALGEAVDTVWMVFAVVVPFCLAVITRQTEESIALGTYTYEQRHIEQEVERRMSIMLPRTGVADNRDLSKHQEAIPAITSTYSLLVSMI